MTTPPPGPASPGPSNPKLLATLAYVGGLVTGAVMLAYEKHDRFVRFHAMQSVITFAAVLVMHLVLAGLPIVGMMLYLPFLVTVIGLWIVLMYKAWNGQTFKLPYIGDFAERQLK